MTFYVFQWSERNDLWAFRVSPETDRLPQPEGENHWRLFQIVEEEDLPAALVPLQPVKEQIAEYGYCLLQACLPWPEQASP